jgi:glycosyltransferase involved in cell wall biosynthesis
MVSTTTTRECQPSVIGESGASILRSDNHILLNAPHLVWVNTQIVTDQLDAATYLETTRELRELGWRVTLVAAGRPDLQSFRGVDVLCISKPNVYLFGQFVFHIRLLRLLRLERAGTDLILFHQMSAPWLLPLRLARRLMGQQRPLLVMDTRTLPMSVATWKERLRALFYGLMNRLGNRWADGQTAITQRMAEAVRIPPQKLWGVWPSGVNLDLFAPAQTARRWPVTREPIHLIYVGRLDYERNLMSLCRAVEKANKEAMAFTLSLVGKGSERLALEQFVLRTETRVRVLSVVAHDEVSSLLTEAHLGVLPFPNKKEFQVSSPIKLFEYMAAGLPILATRIVCHTDVLDGGEYTFWADDATMEGLLAALRLVWDARDSLEVMGRKAANAAPAWTWQKSARNLSDALEHGINCSSCAG